MCWGIRNIYTCCGMQRQGPAWAGPAGIDGLAVSGSLQPGEFLVQGIQGSVDLLFGVFAGEEEAQAGAFFGDGGVEDRLDVDVFFEQGVGEPGGQR